MDNLKASVLAILENHKGHDNPIKCMAIAKECGLRDDRAIQEVIEELIRDGYPIAASCRKPLGMFFAQTYQEINEYKESLRKRGVKDILRARDVKRAAQRYFTGAIKMM